MLMSDFVKVMVLLKKSVKLQWKLFYLKIKIFVLFDIDFIDDLQGEEVGFM